MQNTNTHLTMRAMLGAACALFALLLIPAFQTHTVEAVGGPYDTDITLHGARERVHVLLEARETFPHQQIVLQEHLKSFDELVKTEEGIEFMPDRNALRSLARDHRSIVREIDQYLQTLWESELRVKIDSQERAPRRAVLNRWPIEPHEGVSAVFKDRQYQRRFLLPHLGVDIPVRQGSEIFTVADGIVEDVRFTGRGYGLVRIQHQGYETLYGHISKPYVDIGQVVKEGDRIGLSGGRPGTKGAGTLSTGPHLHFELIVNGQHVNPVQYLPYRRMVHRFRGRRFL